MKKLLTTRNADEMALLYAYLQRHNVPVTVSEHGDELELWLTVSSYQAHAKSLIQAFKENPELATAEVLEDIQSEPQAQRPQSFLQQLLQQAGWFTAGYAVVVILTFIGLLTPLAESILGAFLFNPDSFEAMPWAQPWRFFTPALLHFSVLHIVFNVFWWWYLGGRFERYYGSKWLILAFLFCALASNTSQFIESGPYFGGLSGVVYGLFGIATVVGWQNPRHPLFLPNGLIIFMLVWLVIGYTGLLWVNIANTAHTAGLISGLLVGAGIRALTLYGQNSGRKEDSQ
ncbi:rhomboid family intramembrane serine protease [Pseudidiomarina marina]|uniref:Rhomboid family intramembrane serine protease n=1 Tax=Pseudidiomarina marina TaxID=502366 RepID=A0A432YG60_9GAMM|nr:rhomboid family intramembrane serine protease [Pseudidiomarina marina]PHR65002.1 MAG: rhomboid family intramembrane serine protease [Idiomarina sp.]RUO59895.1 rhomboid family intramembrane serine protease [Pseudidiomarina marina]